MIHDPELLDALSAFPTESIDAQVFRATRLHLDPLAVSTSGGRWNPEDNTPILYTSLEFEGALAEISFHWSQFTPLPTKPVVVHRIQISADSTLRLKRADLATLGVEMSQYGSLNYATCQKIGAAAAFLEHDGLIVPSARWNCDNLMLFVENHRLSSTLELLDSTEYDWQDWAKRNGFIPSPIE